MDDYIKRSDAIKTVCGDCEYYFTNDCEDCRLDRLTKIPAADVVKEENILKFYYVRSIDEYWIGRRLDNLYYARYESENQQWVWAYSRYLPWGEHVVSPTSLWKEHTYPSEPEEISFTDWLKGFSQKYVAADVRPVVRGKWIHKPGCDGEWICNQCSHELEFIDGRTFGMPNYCPNCGAEMRERDGGRTEADPSTASRSPSPCQGRSGRETGDAGRQTRGGTAGTPAYTGVRMMEEIDLNAVPFAKWLEESIPALCKMDVKCIGMVAILKDGGVATNFWEAGTNDMAAMGYRIMEEGVLSTLRANGRELREIIDNAEREENDEGKEDDDGT